MISTRHESERGHFAYVHGHGQLKRVDTPVHHGHGLLRRLLQLRDRRVDVEEVECHGLFVFRAYG